MEYQLIKPRIPLDMSAVERVLTNRGIEYEDIEHYLNTTDDDILDPAIIYNMYDGAKLYAKHIY